ncbi:DNA helicase RecQ [Candidatus Uhrbacteria bacterium CG_4_9_14_3_um_filter_50_9]|uniref:DNA helicase RecQ n=1 Tax=Candidatus Uhrbacteria bacterium CG_4_9_14_3_um_filter_50_9 TaxID=1975035 RepID=A0A2M7XD06_9BACT|nr:MAG: DNA helicase RecQ [Candidatus Uhrbacteria bacterium CG_4_9_14_3_um_filter_50_9]
MLDLLKTHFGYDSFRPLQKEIIDHVMDGKDAFVLMPTGGGKSLCYQLPALALPGVTLVVSPLIALMKDQVDALCANGIEAAFLNSSLTPKEQGAVMERARSGHLKILYVAPERVGAFGFNEFLGELEVSLLAIDEAHCISEWGHDFRPDYRNLRSLRMKVAQAPIIALTATATPQVQKDILSQLGMGKSQVFISSFNRENLHYSVRPKFNTTAELVALLKEHEGESAIVYCYSRKNTEEVASQLKRAGIKATAYHAGLPKKDRERAQDMFIRDEVQIIVATIAFGMGIDKPDVRLVVHVDLPKTIEGYYQETGRAGRDGLPSECVLFYSYADRRKQEYFINMIDDEDEQKLATQKLDDMVEYCQNTVCRRFFLLMYFGEFTAPTSCDACDNCVTEEAELVDATEISQKILSAVLKTGERFGAAHVCDVLRGSNKQRIVELRHDTLSVHGIAKGVPINALREYVQSLKTYGYLTQNTGEYPTLCVSQKGRQALAHKSPILLPKLKSIKPSKTKTSRSKSDLDYNEVLFEKLRALRKEIADEQGVPPFVIFGDRTLHEMSFYIPLREDSLSNLFGVGAKKLEAFGETFLSVIRTHAQEHKLEEKSAPEKITRTNTVSSGALSSTLEETKSLLAQKHSIKEVADERGLSHGTILQHIEKLLYTDEAPDLEHIRPIGKDAEKIEAAFKTLKHPSLTAIFKHFNERYSYDELRLVRMFLN